MSLQWLTTIKVPQSRLQVHCMVFYLQYFFHSSALDSFISPSLVKLCGLVVACQVDRWQVELATRYKVAIESLVKGCNLNLGIFTTIVDLLILPLGSYNIVLGIYWLATHQEIIDFFCKSVQCVDDTSGQVELASVQGPVSLQMISTNQMKQSVQKGCPLFFVSISDPQEAESHTVTLDDHPLLREYVDTQYATTT